WKGEPITITFQDVHNLICPLASDQEVAVFLKTCQSLQLNPFANECFLIKYDSREKAAFVIAIDSYLKAAEVNPQFDGVEAGIILKDGGSRLELREGAFVLDEDKQRLAGGWARVYRKDRSRPTYVAVNKNECVKLTREGKPTQFWAEPKQPWMLRKSALKRALVEAFPSLFAGTLATAEVESDIEGELPAAFEDNGQPDWAKFWVRVQNELGLTEKQAHELLEMQSFKESIDNGKTLEDIWDALVKRVQESKTTETYPQPMDEGYEPLFDDVTAPIDKGWLNESLKTLKDWNAAQYIRQTFPEAKGKTIGDAIDSLTPEQKREFVAEVQNRLEAKAK
ncbi:RecT family recombinase, partial [Candidatus Magnetobacterium casense]